MLSQENKNKLYAFGLCKKLNTENGSNLNDDDLFQYFEYTPYKMVFDYIMPKQSVITKIRLMVWIWTIQLFYYNNIKIRTRGLKCRHSMIELIDFSKKLLQE